MSGLLNKLAFNGCRVVLIWPLRTDFPQRFYEYKDVASVKRLIASYEIERFPNYQEIGRIILNICLRCDLRLVILRVEDLQGNTLWDPHETHHYVLPPL